MRGWKECRMTSRLQRCLVSSADSMHSCLVVSCVATLLYFFFPAVYFFLPTTIKLVSVSRRESCSLSLSLPIFHAWHLCLRASHFELILLLSLFFQLCRKRSMTCLSSMITFFRISLLSLDVKKSSCHHQMHPESSWPLLLSNKGDKC